MSFKRCTRALLKTAMYLLGLGLVLVALKLLELSPVADWSWWAVLIPFPLAALWWTWADWSGYTKRVAMEREDARKRDRIARAQAPTGLPPREHPGPR